MTQNTTVLQPDQVSQLDALRRGNLFAFLVWAFSVLHSKPLKQTWHVAAMCYACQELAEGRRTLQLIALPPRHLKSIVGIALSAWMLGKWLDRKILVASYGSQLTAEHTALFRKLIAHPDFKQIFPACIIITNSNDIVRTSEGGTRRTTTPESAATGLGADLIILDDLTMVKDAKSDTVREAANAYVDETLFSRFDDKSNIRISALQQRTHERDVIGHLMDKPGCNALILDAIAQERQNVPLYFGRVHVREAGDVLAPEIESRETLEQTQQMMGAAAYSAQYLQNPTPPGGNRIQWSWFDIYERPFMRDELLHVVQSWDTALSEELTSDYSVCITFGYTEQGWFVLDVLRRRMKFSTLVIQAKAHYRHWRPDRVLIEKASTGGPLASQLVESLPSAERGRIKLWVPRLSKEERVETNNWRLEQGMLACPEEAEWLAEFRKELTAFPTGRLGSTRGRGFMNIDPRTGRQRTGTRLSGVNYSQALANVFAEGV